VLHEHWVIAPTTAAQFAAYLRQGSGRVSSYRRFVVVRNADLELAGVFNLSEIVHGVFCSAYLGYYGFAPSAGRGYMSEGLQLVLAAAFRDLKLHRVEANVQPANQRSLEFLARNGFAREGYSRRYLKIGRRWRDHVRMAILAEDWRDLRRR
jgi:ribosomal-protein-alanine N-acetyltransferase